MDVKLGNVLVDGSNVVTLCNFGIAEYTSGTATRISRTWGYMAHEIFAPESPAYRKRRRIFFRRPLLALLVNTQWF
jgi:hypothetical protein